MAEAFAREIGAKFMRVKGTSFIDGYIATGTDRIRKLFEKARGLNEPIVVFIDEVDAIGRERTKERNDEYANTLVALIQELDQCEREASDRVFVILATNKFGTLDEALRSRFSNTAIEIKAPTADLGQKIMQSYLNDYDHEHLTRPTLWWIKFWTRGWSGRDYENMVKKAYLLAGEGKITKAHILKAMNEACAARSSGEADKDSWFKKKVVPHFSDTYTVASALANVWTVGTIGYGIYRYFKPSAPTSVSDAVQAQIADATRPLLVMVGQLMTQIAELKAGKGAAASEA
jgi:AAA+ superfamily predicted ATPase